MQVKVTLDVRGRVVALEDVTDDRIAAPFRAMAAQVSAKMASLRCPVHAATATNVRIHVDATGNADLKYESCCEKLGQIIGKALG